MKCPVCNYKLEANGKVCNNCGFDDVNKVFINREEADLWQRNTVFPYRDAYIKRTGDLYALKLNMQQLGTPESKLLFYTKLEELMNAGTPILCPVDIEDKGITPILLSPIAGAWLLAIYSGVQSTPCPNHPITAGLKPSAIIGYLWDSTPAIDGLIIDPYDKPVYIIKDTMRNWKCVKDYQR